MVNQLNDQPPTGSEADRNPAGDHIALIYDDPKERISAVTPLIRVGLEKGELCLYISNEENDTDMVEALKAENIDVDKAIGNGGLILTHKQEMYFKQGFFEPEWTLKVIENIADLAKSYGFTAMRIISDMTWIHEKVAGVQKWPEYEAKLNVLNPGISLRIICQYNRKVFSPSSLIIALHAHPKVVSGGSVNKNQFYVPTDQLLRDDYSELELQRMLDSIDLHNSSEADILNRDQALEDMRQKVNEAVAAKQATEDELNDQRARFNDLAERSSDWSWELDENGVYTWSSARVKDILGLLPEDVVGRTPMDLVARDEADHISHLLKKTMSAHVPITALEKEARHKDGHTVYLEMSGMPQFGQDGRFSGYRGIDRDITGRKAAKQAVEESHKRIEESVAKVQEREHRIEALEVALSQLKTVQSEKDAAVQSIKESLRSSQGELNRTNEELGRMRDALDLRDDELALAKTAADAKHVELEEHKASLTLLRQNLEDKEAELQASQTGLAEAQNAVKEREEELTDLSASFKTQSLELAGVKESLSGLEETVGRNAEELITLRQQVEKLNTDLQKAEESLASKGAELDQVREQHRLAQEDVDLRTKELAAAKEENEHVKGELQDKVQALADLASQLEGSRTAVASLKEELQRTEEINVRLEGEKKQLSWAKEQLEDLARVKDRELEDIRSIADQSVSELKVKEEELAATKNELHDHGVKVSEMAAQLLKLNADQNVSDTIVNGLREAMVQRDGWLFAAKTENEHWASTARSVTADKYRLAQDMDRVQSRLQFAVMDLERKTAELTMERDQHQLIREELELRLRELAEIKAQHELSQEERELKIRELEQERDQHLRSVQERDEKLQDVAALADELASSRSELAALRDEHQRSMEEMKSRDDEVTTVTGDLERTRTELAQLQERHQAYASEVESKSREEESFITQVEHARAEIAQLREEKELSARELDSKGVQLASLTSELEAIREELAQVKERQASSLEELERTRTELNSRTEAHNALELKLVEIRDREQGRILELERKTEEITALAGQLEASRSELVGAKEQQAHADQTIEGLAREVESAKAALGTKEAALIEAMSALDTLKGTLTSRVMELNDRTKELEARQQAAAKANEELVRLQEDLGAKAAIIEAARTASSNEATRLRSILNSIPAGLAMISPEGRVICSNPALQELMGGVDLEGRLARDIWPGLDLDKAMPVASGRDGQEVRVQAVAVKGPDGAKETVLTFSEQPVKAVPSSLQYGPRGGPAATSVNRPELEDPLTVILGSVSVAKEYVIPEGRMYGKLKQIEEATIVARQRLLAPSVTEGGASPTPLVKGKGKVLLLDDDEGVLESTEDLLQHLGYSVDVARDGDEALALCKDAAAGQQPFDVAILDLVNKRGVTGQEAAERIRSQCPQIRMVATGPAGALPSIEDLGCRGFSASITKPYPADQLSRLIAEVLNSK